jgi:hypothetical protein
MLDPNSPDAIGEGYTTAYYLVHSMGRGGDSDYEQRDAIAASTPPWRPPRASSGSST